MQLEAKFLGETAREWNLSLLRPMSRLLGQLCKRENSRFSFFTAICLFTALWPFDLRPNKIRSNGPTGSAHSLINGLHFCAVSGPKPEDLELQIEKYLENTQRRTTFS